MGAKPIPIRGPRVKHDGLIRISVGTSRKSTRWQSQELLWSQLLERLRSFQRTQETLAEYKAMPKSQKDEIKDVGGFVGGELKGGRRLTTAVTSRRLITLDADNVTTDIPELLRLCYDFAWCIYSTHSHEPEKPRLRIVIPLTRPVSPEEYQPISRRVAEWLGINQFDKTTFEPHRLMYWPSCPRDVEPLFGYNDGPWLDPDEVLATYTDWRDPMTWPAPVSEIETRQKHAEKAEDPTTKPGIVGAFCRTYDIHEVIETFLSDVYAPAGENRYTYMPGSTTGGLVVYDGGLFAYSHHGTDPCSGKLVNAFDLVRIHKFGERDETAAPGTPVNRLPSYTAMVEFAQKDPNVAQQLIEERTSEIFADFGQAETDDKEWMKKLTINKHGVEATRDNVVTILENDPLLKGKIALNEFTGRAMVRGAVPWDPQAEERPWKDADDAGLRWYLETTYGIDHVTKITDGWQRVVAKHRYHPVRDYLNSLAWDGTERADTLLIDYLGAEDSEYTRAVTRKALVGAVARVFEPGCKWDYVPALIGPQGIGKSTLIHRLGGQWYSDSMPEISNKGRDSYEALLGVWIIEISELSATRKADVEAVKHFISKQTDRFRVAYGRHTQDFPRQCVFWATTNEDAFLKDSTGNRRWWPIPVTGEGRKGVPWDLDQETVNQIWAEAVVRYKAGEPRYLPPHLAEVAKAIQEEHTEEHSWAGIVRQYLDTPLPENWDEMSVIERREYLHGTDFGDKPVGTVQRRRVCVMEIWVELLRGNPKDLSRRDAKELHEIMRGMSGWRYIGKQRFPIYGVQRAYEREMVLP